VALVILLALACRDPVLAEIDAVPLPAAPAAGPLGEVPVVAITGDAVLFDPGPWRELAPETRPVRVLSLADRQLHEHALPALVEVLAPLVDLAVERERPAVVAVAAGPDVPYRAVVRVLYSVGMAQAEDVELRVATPSGPGALVLPFPRYCSGSAATRPAPAPLVEAPPGERKELDADALVEALSPPSGECVAATVTEVPSGLVVELDERGDGRPGCWVTKALLPDAPAPPPVASDWRGAVVVPAEGACPSVPGRDPAALRALLARAAPLGAACEAATLAPRDETRWGEVIELLAAMRERHPSTLLAVALEDPPAGCAPAWVLL
jgi:hypothetical protein